MSFINLPQGPILTRISDALTALGYEAPTEAMPLADAMELIADALEDLLAEHG